MSKPNVFIRGIYSTALTRLFLDAGYNIIFPSNEIQKRFNIPFRPVDNYSKDITIQDRFDRQGISILFKKKVWESLESNNFKDFPLSQAINPNLIVYKARFHKNAIYRGLVIESNKVKNFSYIRLTPEEINNDGMEEKDDLRTTLGRYSRFITDAKEGIFQVSHEDQGKIRASLGSYYTIPGDLIVINPYNNKVIISREIVDGRQKKRLFDLGKQIQHSKKYGYIFRTAAELASDKEILEEVEQLESDLISTQNIITQFPDRIGEIYSNHRSMNIIFPSVVKQEFDEIRRKVLPTVTNHHIIKSEIQQKEPSSDYGQSNDDDNSDIEIPADRLLDYTEELLPIIPQKSHDEISKYFLKRYYDEFLRPRDQIGIIHQKLGCQTNYLSPGYIQSIDAEGDLPKKITIKRRFKEGGLYDGLNTPIERGDYALGEYGLGNYYYVSTYYSQSNDVKGRYFNINTPIQISANGIRYIDLEIDVVENMVGERKIIDRDQLDKAFEYSIISKELYDKAIQVANDILEKKI